MPLSFVDSVGVYVGAGSRHEDLETSGSAYLLEKMLFRGTSSRSKTDIQEALDNLGAIQTNQTGREFSSYSLQVFKNDVSQAVKILGDALSNSTLNENELELVKEEVH
jgi:predicted Zn-dependent peptidase